MYEKFYGFKEKPFQLVPNPAFLYLSPKHQNALTYLEYGLMERVGFILLTGEVGSGKTTLIKHVLNQIESEIEVAVIFNTNVTADQLLGMILNEFEIDAGSVGKTQALDLLYQYLIRCYSRDRRVLLIIDEAQNLTKDALEEIRMLSNLQTDDQMLLQIMLVGQPEIRDRLRSRDMAQFNQRISVAYHLPALTSAETGEYIAFRLRKAGGREDLFTPEAVEMIHRASGGIPRTINILCDSALVYGFADEIPVIDAPEVELVLHDRDGMGLGLTADEPEPVTSDVEGGAQAGGGLMSRVSRIEARVAKLQAQVECQIDALEKSAGTFKDDLVQRMKDLYTLERNKNDRLIFEYSRLRERYLSLQKEAGDEGESREENEAAEGDKAGPATPEQEDLITRIKKIIIREREKNRGMKAEYEKLKHEHEALLKERAALEKERHGFQVRNSKNRQKGKAL